METHRSEWPRIVGAIGRRFGDLDLAEDATAEAFEAAVVRWAGEGVPPNPGAWLMTAAMRKAIDHLRRESLRGPKQASAGLFGAPGPEPVGAVADDRLRLIFTCCHPALSMEAQVALTLRLVAGLDVSEIARAFLVSDEAMKRRITRAKAKIRTARIPYRIPGELDLPVRVEAVLAVVYLVFNEGYQPTHGDRAPLRHDLVAEAIRLARLLGVLLPEDGEVAGLLALLLLIDARRAARITVDGQLVALDQQDRSRWDAARIAEGHRLVRRRIASGEPPGRYEVMAAINAVHTSAADAGATDWRQIVALYDQLLVLDPSPIVELNRAVALGEVEGPASALVVVDGLRDSLEFYVSFHAARAHLLQRLGRSDEAAAALEAASGLATSGPEREWFDRRRHEIVE